MQPMIRHIRAPAGNRLRRTSTNRGESAVGIRQSTISSRCRHQPCTPVLVESDPIWHEQHPPTAPNPVNPKTTGLPMMAKPRSSPSLTSNLSRCGRRSCSRFRARSAPAYAPSPASANTIQPTVVMVCASCCSCSPYCSARPNGSASAVHSASCFTPSRPGRRAAGVARRRGLPTHAQFR